MAQLWHCTEAVPQAATVALYCACARLHTALCSVSNMSPISIFPIYISQLHHILCKCCCTCCYCGGGPTCFSQPSRSHGMKHAWVCHWPANEAGTEPQQGLQTVPWVTYSPSQLCSLWLLPLQMIPERRDSGRPSQTSLTRHVCRKTSGHMTLTTCPSTASSRCPKSATSGLNGPLDWMGFCLWGTPMRDGAPDGGGAIKDKGQRIATGLTLWNWLKNLWSNQVGILLSCSGFCRRSMKEQQPLVSSVTTFRRTMVLVCRRYFRQHPPTPLDNIPHSLMLHITPKYIIFFDICWCNLYYKTGSKICIFDKVLGEKTVDEIWTETQSKFYVSGVCIFSFSVGFAFCGTATANIFVTLLQFSKIMTLAKYIFSFRLFVWSQLMFWLPQRGLNLTQLECNMV